MLYIKVPGFSNLNPGNFPHSFLIISWYLAVDYHYNPKNGLCNLV